MAIPAYCFFVGRSLKSRVLTSMTRTMVPVLKMGYTRKDGSLSREPRRKNDE